LKTFIKQNQIIIFLILTLILSWFPWYAGIAPEVMAMGPSIAAFIIVLFLGGKKSLFELLRPFGKLRAKLPVWLLAIFGTALMYLLGIFIYVVLDGEKPPFTMIRTELSLIPMYLLMVVLMPWNGPVGEEFGWRGFLLPRLQKKYGPLIASIAIGTFWGFWHLPSFFAPLGVISSMVTSVGFIFIIPYTLGTIANSIFMTWLFNRSKGSALIAGIIWHAAIDFWAPILLSDSSLVAAREGTHLPTIPAALYLTSEDTRQPWH